LFSHSDSKEEETETSGESFSSVFLPQTLNCWDPVSTLPAPVHSPHLCSLSDSLFPCWYFHISHYQLMRPRLWFCTSGALQNQSGGQGRDLQHHGRDSIISREHHQLCRFQVQSLVLQMISSRVEPQIEFLFFYKTGTYNCLPSKVAVHHYAACNIISLLTQP